MSQLVFICTCTELSFSALYLAFKLIIIILNHNNNGIERKEEARKVFFLLFAFDSPPTKMGFALGRKKAHGHKKIIRFLLLVFEKKKVLFIVKSENKREFLMIGK